MTNRRVSVGVDADINGFNRAMLSGADHTRRWVRELESADSRLANLVQTGLALAPAFAPIGASIIPAVVGLTNQLGFAVAAAGTTVLAFQGVGDALDALNDYQIDPTAKNLEKLNEKLDAIGPAGEVFVRQLQAMRPELQRLQDAAQAGLFPGLSEGIEDLMGQMPLIERFVGTVATATGNLAADTAAGLTGPEFVEFFEYLDREAGPTIEATGHAIGNLIEGISDLIMATDPLADDWVQGLEDYSERFRDWADGLDSTQGFQEFVSYVRENGPEVLDLLGALGMTLVDFAEAAAPVGAASLPILEAVVATLGALAASPAGPVIVGIAAAVGTLGRSLALLQAVGLRGGGGGILSSAVGSVAVTPIRDMAAAVFDVDRNTRRASLSVAEYARAEEKRSAAIKGGLFAIGRTSAAVGGLAVGMSGVADEIGLTNTATLGLAGFLLGPLGGAIGTTTGLLLDFRGQINASGDALEAVTRSIDVGALQSAQQQIGTLNKELAETLGMRQGLYSSPVLGGDLLGGGFDLLTGTTGKINTQIAEAEKLRDTFDDLIVGANYLGQSLGTLDGPTQDLAQLEGVLAGAKPAMDALGISVDDLAQGVRDGSIIEMANDISQWMSNADSARGRTEVLAEAFRALDNELIDTSTSAEMVSNALDALLDPGLSLSAATDAWNAGLRNLRDELDKSSKSLTAQTDAGDKNRAAIRDRVTDLKDLISAQAAINPDTEKLTRTLRTQRDALIDAGKAAGLSEGQLRTYLRQLGLTPALVKTLVELNTDSATEKLAKARAQLDALDGRVARARMEVVTEYRTVGNATDALPQRGRGGFGIGGYTGDIAPSDVAGVVHGDEHVIRSSSRRQLESSKPGALDYMNMTGRWPGYMGGGRVAGLPPGLPRGLAGYADGGRVGTNAEILAVLEAEQRIRDLIRELRADGKDRVRGNRRDIVQQELKVARDDLRETRRNVGAESREQAEERATRQRQADEDRVQALLDLSEQSLDGFRVALEAAQSAVEDQETAVRNAEAAQDELTRAMDALGAAVTARYTSGLWDTQTLGPGVYSAGSLAANAGDPFSVLDRDIADISQQLSLIDKFKEAGLTGTPLQEVLQSASLDQQESLLNGGRLAEYSNKFLERETMLGRLDQASGMAVFGDQYNALAAETARQNTILLQLKDQAAAAAAAQAAQQATSDALQQQLRDLADGRADARVSWLSDDLGRQIAKSGKGRA